MTATADELNCTQEGCPFPASCFEGFSNFEDCPHTSVEDEANKAPDDGDSEVANADDDAAGDGVESDAGDESSGTGGAPEVDIGGAEALTLDDAGRLMAKHRCTVALIAGEAKAGKTTLVVELYARFLLGPYGNWQFAGSHTLRALDIRHFTAQQASGNSEPYTGRTQDEDMRLLHLSLEAESDSRSLLFSDVRGEFFDEVIDGAPVAESVKLAPRADRCIVTIDGERLAQSGAAETAFMRARMLMGGLMEAGGLDAHTPIAIVCTKWDQVEEGRRPAILRRAEKLAVYAASSGRTAKVFAVSVRPGPPVAPIEGLEELLEWLTSSHPNEAESENERLEETGRQFWRTAGKGKQ